MIRNQSGTNPTWARPYSSRRLKQNSGAYTPGERRQRAPARGCDEEAGLSRGSGCPLGLRQGRASVLQAKPSLQLLARRGVPAQMDRGGSMPDVRHGIMNQQWLAHFTGEVPQGPGVQSPVTPRYKLESKGGAHALVALGRSRPARLRGCQQSQSRPGLIPRPKGNTDNRSVLRSLFMGKVSPSAPAPKWSDRTSSCQPGGSLSNAPDTEVPQA